MFISHIHSHSGLPGPLSNGNAKVDSLLIGNLLKAQSEHALHHTNSLGLQKRFHLTRAQTWRVVRQCPSCAVYTVLVLSPGCNPWGLTVNHIWQMDVTYYSPFGHSKYIHHTIDTHSHFQWATPLSLEKADSVITHLLACFAVMGIPHTLKTDNAPVYTSKKLANFLTLHNIQHLMGIPLNSEGQAII